MSDDLISRQDAIDALGERPLFWSDNDDYTLGTRNQYDMDRLAIETVPSAQPELNRKNLLRTMMAGILATSSKDAYYCGFRNGIRWCRALLDDKEPEYEEALPVQPERAGWIPDSKPPTENGPYLVWMPFAPEGHHITVTEWCGSYWNIKTPITAYMPLPEPYKEPYKWGGQWVT